MLTLIGDTGRAPQASAQVNPQAVAFQYEVLGIEPGRNSTVKMAVGMSAMGHCLGCVRR